MMTDNSDSAETNTEKQRREHTIQLSVPEMDCPSYAGKVDKSLQRTDGVVETELQPTTGGFPETF